MAFCRLVVPLLVLSVVSASNVPVFLWGDLAKPSLKSNPLSTVSAEEFKGILKTELQDEPSRVVVFVEQNLSVEDFSRKNVDGETSFPYLHANLGDALYLPSVQNALEVLNKNSEGAVHVKFTDNGLTEAIEDASNRAIFISLEDAKEGESRYEMLRRHSELMEQEVTKLQKDGDVVAVYTARNPSWTIPVSHSRVRRQANNTGVSTPDYSMDGVRLYATDITVSQGNTTVSLTNFAKADTAFNNTEMNTTMTFDQGTITLNFRQAGGYWFFDSVNLVQTNPSVNELLYVTSDVNAIMGFSYRCKQSISFASINDTVPHSVTFIDMKVQPFFGPTNETQEFGDSFNCVGFFSAPIWAGLFVVFILLGITFYGIMTMMDIRTMDRFDDPKGKTITINAGE